MEHGRYQNYEKEPSKYGLLLVGPPASGKDTISRLLQIADPRFKLFVKLKLGSGRTDGYRMITASEYQALVQNDDILHETGRFGNKYIVDRTGIEASFVDSSVPILHTSSLEDMRALRTSLPGKWTTVLLWTDRDTCAARSIARGDSDTAARLRVWDMLQSELEISGLSEFNLVYGTQEADPDSVAKTIHNQFA